jgi:hypothetical protein
MSAEKRVAYNNLIGNISTLTGTSLSLIKTSPIPSKTIFVPLQFWFNTNISLALPLLAIQTDQGNNIGAKFVIQFEKASNLLRGNPTNVNSLRLGNPRFIADNIFLSKDERIWFTRNAFDVIIPQLQLHSTIITSKINHTSLKSFNHPILEFIWVLRDVDKENATDITKSYINFTDSNKSNPVEQVDLKMNGIKRQTERSGSYYNKFTTYQVHSKSPESSGILVMPFCTKPESYQEYSGSLDITSLDDVLLTNILKPSYANKNYRLMIFARNYNVLKFKDGLARLKYTI